MEKRPGVGVAVMVLMQGKVLLGRRNDDPEKAGSLLHGEGTWTLPGGKLDFHERPAEGAVRECLEETGINIKNPLLMSVGNEMVHDAHFITLGFLSSEFEGEPTVMEPEEITEWRWFPLGELPKPLFLPAEKIIKNYINKIIYSDE
jgi:ADP-ribose pyrophosphatase YjhB (NUDIX family)